MDKKLAILAVNAVLVSVSLLLIRYGGKSADFSHGIYTAVSTGFWWFAGIALSWCAGLFFSLILTRMALTTAASYYVPLTYLFSFVGGVFFLKEPISPYKIFGSVLVLVGLYLFNK